MNERQQNRVFLPSSISYKLNQHEAMAVGWTKLANLKPSGIRREMIEIERNLFHETSGLSIRHFEFKETIGGKKFKFSRLSCHGYLASVARLATVMWLGNRIKLEMSDGARYAGEKIVVRNRIYLGSSVPFYTIRVR